MIEPAKLDGGRVLLYFGDGISVMQSMDAASVDFVFTDPPYGHHNNNNGDLIHRIEAAMPARRSRSSALAGTNIAESSRPIANDGPEASALVRAAFAEFARLLKPGCCCCCCCGGGGGPDPQFARWSLWLDEVLDFKQMVVWDKGPMGMGWHYRRSYETVLVAQKPGAACNWQDTTNRVENIIRPGHYGIRKIIPSSEQHPTEKPPELAAHFIRLHSRPDELVVDPFMGGGSSGIAAVRLGRRFIGVELDPKHYLDAVESIKEELRLRDGRGSLFDAGKKKEPMLC
jgi:site-specific DNA-methyltransferase (adenine-specific)